MLRRLLLPVALLGVVGAVLAVLVAQRPEPAAAPAASPSPQERSELVSLPGLRPVGVADAVRTRPAPGAYPLGDALGSTVVASREAVLTAQVGAPLQRVRTLQVRVLELVDDGTARALLNASVAGEGLAVVPLVAPLPGFGPDTAVGLRLSPGGFPELRGYAVAGRLLLDVAVDGEGDPEAFLAEARVLVPALLPAAPQVLG